jgi:hypothetical protein
MSNAYCSQKSSLLKKAQQWFPIHANDGILVVIEIRLNVLVFLINTRVCMMIDVVKCLFLMRSAGLRPCFATAPCVQIHEILDIWWISYQYPLILSLYLSSDHSFCALSWPLGPCFATAPCVCTWNLEYLMDFLSIFSPWIDYKDIFATSVPSVPTVPSIFRLEAMFADWF